MVDFRAHAAGFGSPAREIRDGFGFFDFGSVLLLISFLLYVYVVLVFFRHDEREEAASFKECSKCRRFCRLVPNPPASVRYRLVKSMIASGADAWYHNLIFAP
jgi:hypothetical protein